MTSQLKINNYKAPSTHISKEFRETALKLMELIWSVLALEVFVPKTRMSVDKTPLKFD